MARHSRTGYWTRRRPTMAGEYSWSTVARRYRDPRGRFIPTGQALRSLERDLAGLDQLTDRLTEDYRSGRLSLEMFRLELQTVIKHVHMGAATLAKGGRAQMQPDDYGRVGQIVREQYQFLEDWTLDIANGIAPLDGRLTSRARSYIPAGRSTYVTIRGVDLEDVGFDQERSVTQPAEHCDECLIEAAKDWQPRGQMKPIGKRTCRSNDKCRAEFRNSQTGEVIAA